VSLWSTVFETGVSAVSISIQKNEADCRKDYEPRVLSV